MVITLTGNGVATSLFDEGKPTPGTEPRPSLQHLVERCRLGEIDRGESLLLGKDIEFFEALLAFEA